ncbi:MAG: lasso peptide biosynthesis B2 protein [bacterium]
MLRLVPIALFAEVGLRFFPLPVVARLLGLRLGLEKTSMDGVGSYTPDATDRLNLAAVDMLFRNWPFDRTCLRRALVLGHILRCRSPVLRIGVARGSDEFQAHAWIEIEGVRIREGDRGFVPLSGACRSPEGRP